MKKVIPTTRRATRMQSPIWLLALLFVLACLCGCASLFDRARSELDRLDVAALLDRFLERIDPEAPTTGDEPAAQGTPTQTGDEINLAEVTWHGPDVRGWAVTSEMPSGAYVSGSDLHFPHTKASKWPQNGEGLEGNPWIVAHINGAWHAASFEWLRSGQTSKPWWKVEGGHIKAEPFIGWSLSKGEECYVIVTALARGSSRSVAERTAARKVVWK